MRAARSDLNLSGRPKVWFMIRGGNSGKTVEVRWLVGRMAEQGRQAILAALDPANRSLATWFEQVEQPPSSDGAQTARWLREFLSFIMAEKSHNAVLDFGAGDTSLAKLIDTAPDIAATLEGEGIAPVACYTLTPRLDDVAALETLRDGGLPAEGDAAAVQRRPGRQLHVARRGLRPGGAPHRRAQRARPRRRPNLDA